MPNRIFEFQNRFVRRIPDSFLRDTVSDQQLLVRGINRVELERLVERVNRGEVLNPNESVTLFSIISSEFRPTIAVADDLPEPTDHPLWLELNDAASHAVLGPVCKATGQIEYSSGAEYKPYGTGFMVGEDLVMTNRHVADIFSVTVPGHGNFLRFGYDVRINFCREIDRWDTDPTASRVVTDVVMLHPWFDLALLKIDSGIQGVEPLKLAVADASSFANKKVAVIGYPSRDPDENVDLQRLLLREFDCKHISPGAINAIEEKLFAGRTQRAIGHDSSTLTGNSGSPLVDLESGSVVGLHFHGKDDDLNWAVPSSDIASDQQVIDAGATFDGIALAQSGPWETAWAVV